MSYDTSYDEKRFQLKRSLEAELEFIREELLGKKNYGWDFMKKGYAIGIYKKLEELIDDI